MTVVKLVISYNSLPIARTGKEMNFSRKYDASIVAVFLLRTVYF